MSATAPRHMPRERAGLGLELARCDRHTGLIYSPADCRACQARRADQDDEARAIGYAILGISPEQAAELALLDAVEAARARGE